MNKKILVYYSQLNMGGAEKSLIRLMNALANDGNEVTLLCRYGNGSCEYLLDERVKKIALSLREPAKKCGVGGIVRNSFLMIQRAKSILSLKLTKKEYDIAFVGLQGLSPEVICKYVRAAKRAVFIRSDVATCGSNERVVSVLKEFEPNVDYFVCVAETVRDSLVKMLPDTATKTRVIYNLLNKEEMQRNIQNAENPFLEELDDCFRIVTVCRIADVAKGIFRMVHICKKLKEEGFSFRWYVVGNGPDFEELKKAIVKNNLEDIMYAVGRVDNPFGYYRYCDLVAVLSYYEGLCGIVNEAKVAGKAVIATEFSGIHEQLTHEKNGWIVENGENAILEGMRYLLNNPVALKSITNDDYPQKILDDSLKLTQIYDLMK